MTVCHNFESLSNFSSFGLWSWGQFNCTSRRGIWIISVSWSKYFWAGGISNFSKTYQKLFWASIFIAVEFLCLWVNIVKAKETNIIFFGLSIMSLSCLIDYEWQIHINLCPIWYTSTCPTFNILKLLDCYNTHKKYYWKLIF